AQRVSPRPLTLFLHDALPIFYTPSLHDALPISIDLQGSIWTLPAGGGDAKRITDVFTDARHPAWSPDGRWIAFNTSVNRFASPPDRKSKPLNFRDVSLSYARLSSNQKSISYAVF